LAVWRRGLRGADTAGVLIVLPLRRRSAAILLCGLGYAEGATLSRLLGGWQVISWALALALPVLAIVALATLPGAWSGIGLPIWAGLAYVSVFSMLVGFVFWYRGLALGGIAGVGQLQLLQPFFGLALAGLLLQGPVARRPPALPPASWLPYPTTL
jgi:drug/metabolite transporter (DMT)-like permease